MPPRETRFAGIILPTALAHLIGACGSGPEVVADPAAFAIVWGSVTNNAGAAVPSTSLFVGAVEGDCSQAFIPVRWADQANSNGQYRILMVAFPSLPFTGCVEVRAVPPDHLNLNADTIRTGGVHFSGTNAQDSIKVDFVLEPRAPNPELEPAGARGLTARAAAGADAAEKEELW